MNRVRATVENELRRLRRTLDGHQLQILELREELAQSERAAEQVGTDVAELQAFLDTQEGK